MTAEAGDGTVGKALDVLDAVAAHGRPVRFSDLLADSAYPKATLYRFCPTRDQLIDRLIGHAADTLSRAMRAAELERHAPLEALRRLTAHCQDHQTLLLFLMLSSKGMAGVSRASLVVIAANIAVDLIYMWLDPRIEIR